MEIIIGLIVIITLLLILGINWGMIVVWIVYAVTGLIGLTELLFIYCFIRMIAAKSVRAQFTRIGKAQGKGFDRAYYSCEDGEFANIYPCEVVMRDRIYRKDKTVRIRVDRIGKNRKAFDRNAAVTIILGLVLCPLCIAVPVILIQVLNV